MQASNFQDALASVARTVGRKSAAVVFGGTNAYTDGDTIHLPALPPTALVSQHHSNVIRGFRTHEAMHVRITDSSPEFWKSLDDSPCKHPYLKDATNAIEDVRIEHAAVDEYSGAAVELAALAQECTAANTKRIEGMSAKTGTTVAQFVQANVPPIVQVAHVVNILGRRAVGIHAEDEDSLLPHISPELLEIGQRLAAEAARLDTGMRSGTLDEAASRKATTDSLRLAERMCDEVEAWEKQASKPNPPPQGGEPEEGEEGDEPSGQQGKSGKQKGKPSGKGSEAGDGEQAEGEAEGGEAAGKGGEPGEGEGEGEGEGGEADSGQDDGEESKEEEAQQPVFKGAPPAKGAGGVSSGGGQKPVPQSDIDDLLKSLRESASSAVEDLANEVSAAAHKKAGSRGKTSRLVDADSRLTRWVTLEESLGYAWNAGSGNEPAEADALARKVGEDRVSKADTKAVDKALAATGPEQATIRRILERELQAMKDRRWQSGYTSGRLPSHRMVDAMRGSNQVYQMREDGKDMDTLVHLAIDCSGSMGGSEIEEARMMAIALCSALERSGTDLEITTWDGRFCDNNDVNRVQRDANRAAKDIRAQGHIPQGNWCLLTRVKRIKDRLASEYTRRALSVMTQLPNGGTPLGQAVMAVLKDVAKHKHQKRVVIVMTDGDPDDVMMGRRIMKLAHAFAAKNGIHMIGVGFGRGGMNVSNYFDNHAWAAQGQSYQVIMTALAKHIAKESGRVQRAA